MKYSTILFDLDNTLWDFDLAEKLALSDFFLKKGLSKDKLNEYIQNYKIINKKLWEKLEKSKITRSELLNSRFYDFFKTLDIQVDGEQYSKEYEKIIGLHGETIEGAYEFLENLKENGYRLYAVTNGIYNIQVNRLKNSSITKFFEDIFISEKIGFVKPDIRFFKNVEDNIVNFDKEKTILIGDSLTADIKGANIYGIDSIWYNPHNKDLISDVFPKYIVKNYNEILNILYL